MGFYRFMASQHMDSTLSGCLRLSSLNYYRLLEAVTGDARIGDQGEGRSTIVLDFLSSKDNPVTEDMRRNLAASGVIIGEGLHGNMDLSGNIFVSQVDGFILCFYAGDLEFGKAEFVSGTYNSCVSFSDPVALANFIFENGAVDGRSMSDYFHPPQCSIVTYGKNTTNACNEVPVQVSAFLKDFQYSGQSEYRIFFPNKDGANLNRDSIFIETVLPSGFVTEVFRGAPVNQEQAHEVVVDLAASFKGLVDCLNAINLQWDADVFCREWRNPTLKNYWALRETLKWDRLDKLLTSRQINGGALTGIRFALSDYLTKLHTDFGYRA